MPEPVDPEAVERIEIFSRWTGFADPPSHAAKLTITRDGEQFRRTQALSEPAFSELPRDTIARFLAALARPAIAELDPAKFSVPEAVVRGIFKTTWTDDYPSVLFHVHLTGGGRVDIRSDVQRVFMLPFQVTTGEGSVETFDPELSRAISELLPDGFLGKERLLGIHSVLQCDAERLLEDSMPHENGNAELEPCSGPPEPVDPAMAEDSEGSSFSFLSKEETPEEKAEAEQSGQISERLLKRISLDDVRDIIARGADVNVADDVGQTALMHAAFPPFDQLRFRLLVEAGADVDARRGDATGLHIACAGGAAEAASEWVRAGADIHATTPEKETPLMLGAKWPGVVELLIRHGADVNATDAAGHSALVYAIVGQSSINAEEHIRALQLLLAAGADVQAVDLEGNTPLDHGERELERVLLEEEVRRAFHAPIHPIIRNKNSSASSSTQRCPKHFTKKRYFPLVPIGMSRVWRKRLCA